jgi:hypothetical protein
MCLFKMLTRDFGIEPSSDNDAQKTVNHAHFRELFSNIMKTNNYT